MSLLDITDMDFLEHEAEITRMRSQGWEHRTP